MIHEIYEKLTSETFVVAVGMSWVITALYALMLMVRACYLRIYRVLRSDAGFVPGTHVRAPAREWTEVDRFADDE